MSLDRWAGLYSHLSPGADPAYSARLTCPSSDSCAIIFWTGPPFCDCPARQSQWWSIQVPTTGCIPWKCLAKAVQSFTQLPSVLGTPSTASWCCARIQVFDVIHQFIFFSSCAESVTVTEKITIVFFFSTIFTLLSAPVHPLNPKP